MVSHLWIVGVADQGGCDPLRKGVCECEFRVSEKDGDGGEYGCDCGV